MAFPAPRCAVTRPATAKVKAFCSSSGTCQCGAFVRDNLCRRVRPLVALLGKWVLPLRPQCVQLAQSLRHQFVFGLMMGRQSRLGGPASLAPTFVYYQSDTEARHWAHEW